VRDVLVQALCTGKCDCDFDARLAQVEDLVAQAAAEARRPSCGRKLGKAVRQAQRFVESTTRRRCRQPADLVDAVTGLRDRLKALRRNGFCDR
jgi:hypothetical protein